MNNQYVEEILKMGKNLDAALPSLIRVRHNVSIVQWTETEAEKIFWTVMRVCSPRGEMVNMLD